MRLTAFKLFPGQWEDLEYATAEALSEAIQLIPATGKKYKKICVGCELRRRQLWMQQHSQGSTSAMVPWYADGNTPESGNASVVEVSPGSGSASGGNSIVPPPPPGTSKRPWASREAIQQELKKKGN